MRSADIVIAGGGPGGLETAATAARAGCSVVVIEQNKEIGSPIRTSGGSFIREMKALGIPERLYFPIRKCRFLAPGNSAQFDYEEPILCIIDVKGVYQFLAERAISAGAKIMLGATAVEAIVESGTVTGLRIRDRLRDEFHIASHVLVDATGYRSTLLKQAGLAPGFKRFGVGAEYDLFAPHFDQSEALLIVGSQVAPSGYAWMFPWGNHRVRVGVGVIHNDSTANPDRYLDSLIRNGSQFGVNLNGAEPIEYHTGLIPSDGLAERFVGDGVMAVGDAAGQPSALVGEGIRWAMHAGRMAGQIAADAIAANDVSRNFLSRYESQWKSTYGKDLRAAYEINKRIARWDDDKWNRRTELLKLFTPQQFGEALATNLFAGWAMNFLWKNPSLLKAGFRELANRI